MTLNYTEVQIEWLKKFMKTATLKDCAEFASELKYDAGVTKQCVMCKKNRPLLLFERLAVDSQDRGHKNVESLMEEAILDRDNPKRYRNTCCICSTLIREKDKSGGYKDKIKFISEKLFINSRLMRVMPVYNGEWLKLFYKHGEKTDSGYKYDWIG